MNRVELEKKIRQECDTLLKEKGYISSVDLLMGLEYLSKSDYEKWRQGKVPFWEKVCQVNLGKLNYINKILRKVAIEKELKDSWTAYMRWGKGPKIPLDHVWNANFLRKSQLQEPDLRHFYSK